jgi:Protein of unknown function (DUF2946)
MPSACHMLQERKAITALFVVFALMVQALVPVHAMAADNAGGVTICTATGTHSFTASGRPDSPAQHHGAPCQDCLAAAMAAAAPAPVLAIQPVAYALARVEHVTPRAVVAPRARAPPRPLGQGPPNALQTV